MPLYLLLPGWLIIHPFQKKIRNQISSKNVSGREVGKLKKGSDIYDFRIGNVRARQSSKIRRKMHGGAQVAGPKNHARNHAKKSRKAK